MVVFGGGNLADAGLAVSMIEEGMKIMKKYKNLIIVGNGFDRWQNLPTSYENFRLYYQDHIISSRLRPWAVPFIQ